LQCLLDARANPDLQGIDGSTPLLCAVQYGHRDTAERLVDAGADVAIPNRKGMTVEKWDREYGSRLCVEMLSSGPLRKAAR